jgi:predicted nucleotidyltransferase
MSIDVTLNKFSYDKCIINKNSDGLPLSLEVNFKLDPMNISEIEDELSKKLNLPICLLAKISNDNNIYKYRLLHKNSVIITDEEQTSHSNMYRSIKDELFTDKEIRVLGLWDGNSVEDLLPILIEYINTKEETFFDEFVDLSKIRTLQGQRVFESILKKERIGVEASMSITYFLDKCENALILMPSYRESFFMYTNNISDFYLLLQRSVDKWGLSQHDILDFLSENENIKHLNYPNDTINLNFNKILKTSNIVGSDNKQTRLMHRFHSQGSYSSNYSNYFHGVGLSIYDTHKLLISFVEEKYLEIDKSLFARPDAAYPLAYISTEAGLRFAAKKNTKRAKRKTLDNLVKLLIERSDESKALDCFKYEVHNIFIFGSYLDDNKEDYGDLDTVIIIRPKKSGFKCLENANKYDESSYKDCWLRIERAFELYESGKLKHKPKYPEQYGTLSWDSSALLYNLKRKNNLISLHGWNELLQLKTEDILIVYDKDKGGKIKPLKCNKFDFAKSQVNT